MKKCLLVVSALLGLSAPAHALVGGGTANGGVNVAGVPLPAAGVGYNVNTFSSTFNNDVDVGYTNVPGFNWYLWNWFSPSGLGHANAANITITPGVSAYFAGENIGPNAELSSADVDSTNSTFVGTAFGGGGYFEATISFDPTTFTAAPGWPAWWSMSIEHAAYNSGLALWTGQITGYSCYNELDFMEYMNYASLPNSYVGTLHTHYNQAPANGYLDQVVNNSPNGGNIDAVASYTMFRNPHTYGVLWVPHTSTTPGYAQYYFDRKPVGTAVTWTAFVASAHTPPPAGTWAFGVIDNMHLALILGTGTGSPMTVYKVQVWQASSANNITHL